MRQTLEKEPSLEYPIQAGLVRGQRVERLTGSAFCVGLKLQSFRSGAVAATAVRAWVCLGTGVPPTVDRCRTLARQTWA